jgi:hypothetical protein
MPRRVQSLHRPKARQMPTTGMTRPTDAPSGKKEAADLKSAADNRQDKECAFC